MAEKREHNSFEGRTSRKNRGGKKKTELKGELLGGGDYW